MPASRLSAISISPVMSCTHSGSLPVFLGYLRWSSEMTCTCVSIIMVELLLHGKRFENAERRTSWNNAVQAESRLGQQGGELFAAAFAPAEQHKHFKSTHSWEIRGGSRGIYHLDQQEFGRLRHCATADPQNGFGFLVAPIVNDVL